MSATVSQRLADGFRLLDDDFGDRDEDDWATYDEVDLVEMAAKYEREELAYFSGNRNDPAPKF